MEDMLCFLSRGVFVGEVYAKRAALRSGNSEQEEMNVTVRPD